MNKSPVPHDFQYQVAEPGGQFVIQSRRKQPIQTRRGERQQANRN